MTYFLLPGKIFCKMKIRCIWEHNGDDTLLYAADHPGAFARGGDLKSALEKIFSPEPVVLSWTTAAILICSVLIKLWLT